MFINFTNHPSDGWSQKQRKAACQYGEIVDLPFPFIDPHYTKEDILHIVRDYAEKIFDIKEQETVVHVMGEMTFTHNIVNILKEAGIKCLASTTVRNNDMITSDDGRTPEYVFVQFREY